jgi:hypothetical protein
MIEFEYLKRGLYGMANAPKAGSMAGHLGAAVMTGYFIGEDQSNLPDGVFVGIRRDLNRIMGGEESIWFDPKKAGITAEELFAPLPPEPAQENGIDGIAKALAGNIGKTRQSGHNVIFAAIALRGLKGHSQLATPKILAGIGQLIATFHNAHAGRGYYGKAIGWKNGNEAPMVPEAEIGAYDSMKTLAEAVVAEVIQEAAVHRQGFGGLFHLINHAAALTELDRMGFPDLARQGLPAHRQHLRLLRALPNLETELGKLETTNADPLTTRYWEKTKSAQWEAWLTHRIKTLSGFLLLLRYINDEPTREKALIQFRYLMA